MPTASDLGDWRGHGVGGDVEAARRAGGCRQSRWSQAVAFAQGVAANVVAVWSQPGVSGRSATPL